MSRFNNIKQENNRLHSRQSNTHHNFSVNTNYNNINKSKFSKTSHNKIRPNLVLTQNFTKEGNFDLIIILESTEQTQHNLSFLEFISKNYENEYEDAHHKFELSKHLDSTSFSENDNIISMKS